MEEIRKYPVGINYDSQKRTIGEWKIAEGYITLLTNTGVRMLAVKLASFQEKKHGQIEFVRTNLSGMI